MRAFASHGSSAQRLSSETRVSGWIGRVRNSNSRSTAAIVKVVASQTLVSKVSWAAMNLATGLGIRAFDLLILIYELGVGNT